MSGIYYRVSGWLLRCQGRGRVWGKARAKEREREVARGGWLFLADS